MKHFLVGLFLVLGFQVTAQSLIVGIPSADVADKNHLEITHETQWNFWNQPQKWNSFNFICFGLGNNLELTSTLNNLNNDGSDNIAFGVGAKKVFELGGKNDKYESKLVLGSNFLYSKKKNDFGVWSYGLYSFRLPQTKTRFTGGFSYGNAQTFGYNLQKVNNNFVQTPNNKFVFVGGVEQPLTKTLSFVCDWYSGTHDLAAVIPAMQMDFGHNVLILGYKIPNNKESGDSAIILEFMISINTKKKK